MSILTESVQIENNFHFRAKIFDIGFEPLPFTDETFDFDIFERREGETVEIKKQEAKNEIAAKPSSIDDLLVPSGMAGLAALAIDSYYGNKKAISIKNRILDYIFVPIASRLNASNDNYQITIFHKPIELIVPYSGYSTARLGSGYLAAKDYEKEDTAESFHYYEIKSVNYMQIPRLYHPLFAGREALPYTKPADDNYNTFESSIPEIKFTDGINIVDNYLLHAAYTSMHETYETRIKPINYSRAFTKATAENNLVPIANIPIQAKAYHTKMPTTDYSPRLLEEVVEENEEIGHKAVLYHGTGPSYFFNLPKPQNDNERKNPNKDISDAVVQALEPNEQENQIVYRHIEQEPSNDNFSRESANDADPDSISEIIYKQNPRRQYTVEIRKSRPPKRPYLIPTKKDPLEKIRYKIKEKKLFSNEIQEKLDDLSYDIKARLLMDDSKEPAGSPKEIAMVVQDLETGEYFEHNGNLVLPATCLLKPAAALAMAHYAKEYGINLDQEITLQKDLILARERNIFPYLVPGNKIKLRDSIARMLKGSNTDYNHVLYVLGGGNVRYGMELVNSHMQELGLGSIQINEIHNKGSNVDNNVSNAADATTLMAYLELGILGGEFNSLVLDSLSQVIGKMYEGFGGIAAKRDGVAISGVIGKKYAFTIIMNDFHGKYLSEDYVKEGEKKMGPTTTDLGTQATIAIQQVPNKLYNILKPVEQKKAA